MRNGTVPAVRSSTNSLFAPPLNVSFALICQSVLGKPGEVDVSSNLRRTLFAFPLIVAVPMTSLLVQSAPPQRPPAAETKSGKNVSGAVLNGGRTAFSRMFGGTTAPLRTVKTPLCTRLPSLARSSYAYWPSLKPSTRSIGLPPAANVLVTTCPSGRCSERTTASCAPARCHSTVVAVVTSCAANAPSEKSAVARKTKNRMLLPPFVVEREAAT